MGTAFAVNVLTAQALGPAGRGEVAYVLQVAYLLAPFLLLGTDRSLLRGQEPYRRALPDLRASALLAGILLLAFSIAAYTGFQPRLWQSVPVAFVGVVLAATRAKGIAARRPSQFLAATIGYQVFILGATLTVFISGSESTLLWVCAYSIPGLLALAWIAIRGLTTRRRMVGRHFVDRSAIRLLPGSLATIVVTRGERLALPIIADTYQLGLYMVVATATELVAWGGQTIADMFVRASPAHNPRRRPLLWIGGGLAATAFTISVGVALWFAVEPLFGAEFISSRRLVVPLCVAALALCVYRLLIAALIGSDDPGRSSRVEVATAMIAVPTYAALVYEFGAMGAAYGSLVVYVVGCVLAFRSLRTKDA